MITVAIHQPEFWPWLGLVEKARRADVFVLLDDVQFNRASLQHRAKIASPRKPFEYLTIPFVHRHPQLIKDVHMSDMDWPARHLTLIEAAYRDAPAFDLVMPRLREFYATVPAAHGVGFVAASSMSMLFSAFTGEDLAMDRGLCWSSSLGAEGMRGERVLSICKKLGATKYLSGRSGATYLDREMFADAGIEIEVQTFSMPKRRDSGVEVDGLSALDAWMHLGDGARGVLSCAS